jgi:hypothetical protein
MELTMTTAINTNAKSEQTRELTANELDQIAGGMLLLGAAAAIGALLPDIPYKQPRCLAGLN